VAVSCKERARPSLGSFCFALYYGSTWRQSSSLVSHKLVKKSSWPKHNAFFRFLQKNCKLG